MECWEDERFCRSNDILLRFGATADSFIAASLFQELEKEGFIKQPALTGADPVI